MPSLRSLLPAVVAAGVLIAAAPALAGTPEHFEPYATLLRQINAKPGDPQRVIAATIDKSKHHVRVTLANHQRPYVSYPPADDKFLVDTLLQHHIRPVYTKKAAVHHVLRYIAGGVVIVLLLIGGGVWYYTRGRQETGAPEPDSPAPSA